MVTVLAILVPLFVVTGVVEYAWELPERIHEHRQNAVYRRTRNIWN